MRARVCAFYGVSLGAYFCIPLSDLFLLLLSLCCVSCCRCPLRVNSDSTRLELDVLDNWDKYTAKQDGDAIRRLIGTIGVSSPLSSIRKAFTSIRDAEEASVRMDDHRRMSSPGYLTGIPI